MEQTFVVGKSKNKNLNPFILFLFSILVVYTIIFCFFIFYGFYNSLKPSIQYGTWKEYFQLPSYGPRPDKGNVDFSNPLKSYYFPHPFKNYEDVMKIIPTDGSQTSQYYAGWNLDKLMPEKAVRPYSFFDIIFNSLLYALGGSVIIAIVPCVFGYLCAKYPYKFSSFLYALTLFVMIMPLVGTGPARIRLMSRLMIFDTMIGDFIVNFTFANVYFLVFLAFYQGVSGTFAEAAEIDGASQLRTLVEIMMPLGIKMMATITLIFFIGRWNNYDTPLIYLPNTPMIAYRIYLITTYNPPAALRTNVPAKFASAMIVAMPILILFIILRDKIMGNISMGGVKE